jgi:ADP-heptose:LPS heptosyltransferase
VRRKILIIRRENIGDLILTTPLIHAIRHTQPDAYIAALVNSYNAPVLAGNGDLNDVFVYTKGKHADSFFGRVTARLALLRLFWKLRRIGFDDIVLAEPTYIPRNLRLAAFIRGKARPDRRIIGFEDDDGQRQGIDVVACKARMDGLHQAQIVMRLAEPFGANAAVDVYPCKVASRAPTNVANEGLHVALHISARKPSQQWAAAKFAELAKLIHQHGNARFSVFWSPGSRDNALHPGDDEKAAELRAFVDQAVVSGRVVFHSTHSLEDLIAGLARVDLVICADGGAMHVAAGLGKPIVALFGDSDPVRWRPWGVPQRVIQPPSKHVADISEDAVFVAFETLVTECHFDGKYRA